MCKKRRPRECKGRVDIERERERKRGKGEGKNDCLAKKGSINNLAIPYPIAILFTSE